MQTDFNIFLVSKKHNQDPENIQYFLSKDFVTMKISCYLVIGETFVDMKVEYEQNTSSFKDNDFVIFVFPRHISRICGQPAIFLLQAIKVRNNQSKLYSYICYKLLVHGRVESVEKLVSQFFIIWKIELSSGVMI